MCAAVQVLIAFVRMDSASPPSRPRALRRAHCENRVLQRTRRSIGAGANIMRRRIVVAVATLQTSTAVGERRVADATRVAGIAEKFE